jgi:hypothetical protein
LGVRARCRAALRQPELRRLEQSGAGAFDAEVDEAAFRLALALGEAQLFGVALGEDDGILPAATAIAAARGLVAVIEQGLGLVESLGQSWDEARTGSEAEDLAAGLLEMRMKVWAAYEAVAEAEREAVADQDSQVADLSDRLDAAAGRIIELDEALQAELGILSTIADLPLLENWRRMLAAPHRDPMPWWLDGRLEAEAERVGLEAKTWMPDADQWRNIREIAARNQAEKPISLSLEEWLPREVLAAASDEDAIPPLGYRFDDPRGHYEAMLLVPESLPPGKSLVLRCFERESGKEAQALKGERVFLAGVSRDLDSHGMAVFSYKELAERGGHLRLSIGDPPVAWIRRP